MSKKFIKTNREIRLDPKKDLKYLLWFFGIIVFIIIVTELLSSNPAEYARNQSRLVLFILILFIYRFFTINTWGEHYRETINLFFYNQKLDSFVTVSLFNVLFDFFILFCLFFWIETEKVSFARIPIAGLVYVLMIGFSALKRRKK